ncbi:ABC transporter permease [Undibacterium oligocarboniphilum]|uniref:ABC transporter permease n=1 Tax=Undibacterium oligocarboniphilum TaxID=666702 RepID=A0A850QLS2_9BURK|nr:FtsX-like permease family protein [Undibacterium oligocarboniphilum]MBC3870673.1 ABC transporter permease [Undibacterium oligocarboniphilum]NVO78525.1 ABC transporter permease [Undibacterium oligocarboniphilum]
MKSNWLPFEWIVATRFLREGRMQSLFIILGVAIGVGVIVFMSALLVGMQGNLFRRVLSSQPHITLERPKQQATPVLKAGSGEQMASTIQKPSQRMNMIDQWQKVRDQVQRRADIVAVSPTATGPALVIRGSANQAVSLIGIVPEQYNKIIPLSEKIVGGAFRATNTDMMIGTQLAEDMGVGLGDKLRITTASGASVTLNIAGIFDLGSRGANQRNVYVLLSTAQNVLGMVGGVSSIDLTVLDPYVAEDIAQSISNSTGLNALSWIVTNSQFFLAMRAQTYSSLLIRLFVGLSVAAGIASVLVVSVVQRQKEIGILRAMGGSRGQVMRVFLIQGALVGLLGSVIGSLLAMGLLSAWKLVAKNPDGTPMFVIDMDIGFFIWSAVLAMLAGLLAAATPAIRASRLDPVVAIRG